LRRSESATSPDHLCETCRSTSYRLKNQQAVPEWLQQLGEDSPLRLQQDLLRQLLPDWSLRPALLVGRLLELVQLEVVLPLRVLPEAAAVAAPAASSSQVAAVPAQLAAVPRLPDSSAVEHPGSYPRLLAALVPEAELARAKPTRTRL
jgi:hypothetical protein